MAQPQEQPQSEVWQNERFFVGFWKAPPAALDRAEWTDEHGAPVSLEQPPPGDPEGWELEVGPATDAQGWQYGTVWQHLEYKRLGGRASQRLGDLVRRRRWRRRRGLACGGAPAEAGPPLLDLAERSDAEAKRRSVRAFLSMLLDVLSRRQLLALLPWDPSALVVAYRQHQEAYRVLQAEARASTRRAFAAGVPPEPSPLRPRERTLLQDLVCAAMHARAAYGFAMQAGHLSSAAAFIRLHTVQPLSFDAVAGVSAEANTEAVASLAGIDPGDVLAAEWRNSTARPCHYVAIDRANSCIVLAVRGTLSLSDLLLDLDAAPMEVELHGADGWVHPGFFSAATYIHTLSAPALVRAAAACPGWPLLVTGHSMGGGVAALLALLLAQSGLPLGMGSLHCVALAPAAVASWPLAEAASDLITSVVVGSDVVPRLSQASVEGLLLEASMASPVRRAAEDLGRRLGSALGMAPTKAEPEGPGWGAVKDAATRLYRNGSKAGLARIGSLAADATAAAAVAAAAAAAAAVAGTPSEPAAQSPQAPPPSIPILSVDEEGRVISSNGQQQQGQQPDSAGSAGGSCNEAPARRAPAPGADPAAAEQLQQRILEQPLPVLGDSGSDAPGMRSAVADGQVRQAAAGPACALRSSPGDPEKLYPPGRILWVFPADEDLRGMAGPAGAAACSPAGPAEAPPNGEVELTPLPREGPLHQGGRAPASVDPEQTRQAAAEAAATGRDGARKGGAAAAADSDPGEPAAAGPVVVEADRSSFERLLLCLDMLQDHLPDRVLRAMQQL